jgi:hypothetical protein
MAIAPLLSPLSLWKNSKGNKIMNLPHDFHFTASNLQDYLTCQRRFELKAIQHCQWPALPSQPVQEQEEHMRNGVQFHQFANQFFLGIPIENITELIFNSDIQRWWDHFIGYFGSSAKEEFIAFEHTLAGYINSFPLLAKLDAIRRVDDQWMIYDWKTGLHLPKQHTMQAKIQSRLYPYMLASFGTGLNKGQKINPQQIQMTYWFPEFPDQPITLQYSAEKYEEDHSYLEAMMTEIVRKNSNEFSLTDNEKNCIYCVYRSLCTRGTSAGDFINIEEEDEGQLLETFLNDTDIDQIQEIAF